MAIITSATSGDYGTGATWVGGIAPVEGDRVIIASPHVVTISGTHIAGDDTATGFVINNGGTLRASRLASSQLTIKGTMTINGIINYGIDTDPIPAGVTATLIGNYSSALASNKYIIVAPAGVTNQVWFYGASKTLRTTSTAQCNSGQAVISVANATNWAIGDEVVVAGTSGINQSELRTIQSISGNNITMTANFTNTHASGCIVGNLTNNVRIRAHSSTHPFNLCLVSSDTTPTLSREMQYVSLINMGSNTVNTTVIDAFGALTISSTTTVNNVSKYKSLKNLAIYGQGSQSQSLVDFRGSYSFRNLIEDSIFAFPQADGFRCRSGSTGGAKNCYFISNFGNQVVSNFSQAGVSFLFEGCKFTGTTNCLFLTSGTGHRYVNCDFDNCTTAIQSQWGGDVNFENCNFGLGVGTPTVTNLASGTTFGNLQKTYLTNCNFGSVTNMVSQTWLNNSDPANIFQIVNIGGDPLAQSLYTRVGNWFRDNSVKKNSKSSMRLNTANSNDCTYSLKVGAPNGSPITIKGSIQMNASFLAGTYTLPKVTISGLGITPVVFTATATSGTWQDYTLTATQNSGFDGELTVTFSATSNQTGGLVYFDGLTTAPFVTFARHYGYIFDTTNPLRVVNPYITQTNETTVGAYTGIAIDHIAQTITISASRTINEIYDYCYWSLCQSANHNYSEFFTTNDGANYNTTYSIINNGALTGTGTLITTGTYTGSGTTTLVIKDSVGVRCKITSGGGSFTIKGATIAYEADITEKIITVAPSTNVSFVMWKLGYKPQIFTINSGSLGGTFDISMLDITEDVDTALNVAPIIALTSTTVDVNGYHIFFGEMELSLEQMKATVHRLMKYENYFDAVLATTDDNVVEIRSDEIRVNKPLFTIEREASLTIADRVQLNGYINISNAVAIDPLYIINPGDSDGLYVTYLTVKPGIDAEYLAGVVWESEVPVELNQEVLRAVSNISGGHGGFSSQSIQTSISNAKQAIIKKIEEIPQISLDKMESQLNEIVSQNNIAKEETIDRIKEAEIDLRKDIKDVKKELKSESISTRNIVRQKTEKIDKNVSKLADRQDITDKMIEDEADEIEKEFERIYMQEADMIEKELEEQYKREADEIEKELNP